MKKGTLFLAVTSIILTANIKTTQAQELDSILIPFTVNTDATVTVQPPEGAEGFSQARMRAAADQENIIAIVANKQVSVTHRPRSQRRTNAPAAINYQRGRFQLRLHPQQYQNADIALYTIKGRRILREKTTANARNINISRQNIAAGVYLLSIKGVNGHSFATKLTHRGGGLNINVTYGGESNVAPSSPLRKSSAAGDAWTITVQATGHADTTYSFYPVNGMNPAQEIELRQDFVANMRGDTLLTLDGSGIVHSLDTSLVSRTLTSITENQLVFNGLFSGAPYIKANDIVISGFTSNAPDGFFRKVLSVNTVGSVTTMETEPSSLLDIYSRLSIHGYAEVGNIEDDPELQKTASGGWSGGYALNIKSGNFILGGSLTLSEYEPRGSITIGQAQPIFFDMRIDEGELQWMRIQAVMDVDMRQFGAKITLTGEGYGKAKLETPALPLGGISNLPGGLSFAILKIELEFGIVIALSGSVGIDDELIDVSRIDVITADYWKDKGWTYKYENNIRRPLNIKSPENFGASGEFKIGAYTELSVTLVEFLKATVGSELAAKYSVSAELNKPITDIVGQERQLLSDFSDAKLTGVREWSASLTGGLGAYFWKYADLERSITYTIPLMADTFMVKKVFPVFSPIEVVNPTPTSMDISVYVEEPSDLKYRESGFVWSTTNPEPNIKDDHVIKELSGSITGLSSGQTVYISSYVTNWWGTFYGDEPPRTALWRKLMKFYYDTDGPNWKNNTNWGSDSSFNKWHGLDSTANGLVINLDGQNLKGSVDLSNTPELYRLSVYDNQLTSINVSGATNLKYLNASDNRLTSLNVSGLTGLDSLWGDNNQLTSLSLCGLTRLKAVGFHNNRLTSANLCGLSNLEWVSLNTNNLTSINLSGLTGLRWITVDNNQITSLNASGLSNLETLYFEIYNPISSVNITGTKVNVGEIDCETSRKNFEHGGRSISYTVTGTQGINYSCQATQRQ